MFVRAQPGGPSFGFDDHPFVVAVRLTHQPVMTPTTGTALGLLMFSAVNHVQCPIRQRGQSLPGVPYSVTSARHNEVARHAR